MNALEQQEEREEINLTPMLDVVFILLIFFVVLASFIRSGLDNIREPRSATTGVAGAARAASNGGRAFARRATKPPCWWRRTRTGSAFARVRRCCSSFVWNDHTALRAPCRTSRKGRFAATDTAETASWDFGVPVGLPAGTTEHGDIETITVTVEAGRTFNVNGRALAGGSLAPYVRRLSAEFPDAGYAVLVADESRVADTVRAVDAGRRAGFTLVPVSSVP